MQKRLIGFIQRQNIRQIVLVLKRNNTFIVDKVNVKFNLAHYPIEKSLQSIEDAIPEHLENWNTTIPKREVLASNYLHHQISRLRNTKVVGVFADNNKIKVAGLIYDEKERVFYKTENLKRRAELLETISIN